MGVQDARTGLKCLMGAFHLFGQSNRHGGVVGLSWQRAGNGNADDAGFIGHGCPQLLKMYLTSAVARQSDNTLQRLIGGPVARVCWPVIKPFAAAFAKMPLRDEAGEGG